MYTPDRRKLAPSCRKPGAQALAKGRAALYAGTMTRHLASLTLLAMALATGGATARVKATAPWAAIATNSATTSATATARDMTEEAPPPLLISAFLADGQLPDDADEAVQVWNLGEADLDLGGWSLDDGAGRARFPPGARLEGRTFAWLARQSAAFATSFGRPPDWAWEGGGPGDVLPRRGWLSIQGGGPRLANGGDRLHLRRPDGALADAVRYGSQAPATDGWQGPALLAYAPRGYAAAGQVLYRKLDPASALPLGDHDLAADWAADPLDPVLGRRLRFPGWELEERLRPVRLQGAQPASLELAVAPDALAPFLARYFGAATRRLDLVVYSFEQPHLAEVIAERAAAGVRVRLAVEGAPAGGISMLERWCLARMAAAGAAVAFMDRGGDVAARYRGLHAKLAVIDGRWALIGSENPTLGSAPMDSPADGTAGRRGVWLATDEPGVLAWAQGLLDADLDPARADLRPFQARDPARGEPLPDFQPEREGGGSSYQPRFARPLLLAPPAALRWELISSPESSLDPVAGVPGLLARAGPGDCLWAQQLDEPLWWGARLAAAGPPEADPAFNPRVAGYLAAARRGARLRLLLDAYFDDPLAPNSNRATVAFLRARARAEGLDLEARLGNPSGLGLHNKMILLGRGCQGPDRAAAPPGGSWVHLGSLNGSETASKANREAALTVASEEALAYLRQVFEADWASSATAEIVLPSLVGGLDAPP